MPYLLRNGVRLHYRVSGKGPVIALQHALTNDHKAFEITGLRKSLTDLGFQCVTMDSIGHGASDAPSRAERYTWQEQAADLLSVMDAVGAETFTFFGYSMGAWLGTGAIVKAAPGRVRLAVLGGWDPLEGAREFTTHADNPFERAREFDKMIKALFATRPGLSPPPPQQIEAYQRCYAELFQPLPTLGDLGRSGTPLRFFCGENDPYKPNLQSATKTLGAPFEVVPGNHISAYTALETSRLVLRWLSQRARAKAADQ
jgi:pimeloyl-ACP methyl ester carboxylesterase